MLKKRIAHLVSSLEIGGAERFVIDLCQEQQKLGLLPSIISFGKPTDKLVQVCQDLGLEVFTITGFRLSKYYRLAQLCKQFDVFHFHSQHALKFVEPVFLISKPNRVIYTRHGAHPMSSSVWKNMHIRVKKYVDVVTFVSNEGAEIFQQNHGWHDKQLEVIDNGVNLSNISPTSHNSPTLRIGSVGRMVELKHQISLLQAVSLLPAAEKANVEVNFFGDGPCLADLQEYASTALNDVTVNFHGMVSNRDVIYNNIDVLVVTSITEGLSLAIIEAMAYGCMAIGTRVGGNPKLINHGHNGWLFEYDDKDALASYLQQLVNNRELLTSMGDDACKTISSKFSLKACAEKYLPLYSQ